MSDAPTSPAVRMLGTVAAAILGAVLVVAAYAKALDPGLFATQLQDLLPLSAAVAHGLAALIVGVETGLGVALLSGWRRPPVLLLTNATFLAFLGIVLWQYVHPGEEGASCGCFGQLIERTPGQAVVEDLVFVGLSALAWFGRPVAQGITARAVVVSLAGLLGVGAALWSPSLPLDDYATGLAPGMTVAATHLDETIPALDDGRHFVVLLDRGDPAAPGLVAHLNARLKLPGGKTRVWGIAEENAQLAAAFVWSAGPAFEVRSASPRMLRTLYRTLPRCALIDDGHVLRTWSGLPPDSVLDALARGDLP